MNHLLPHPIAQQQQNGEARVNREVVALFLDISGFTPMTEKLMTLGKSGAEVLAQIINSVFRPVITTIYAQGGFICGFAGDAFTAIFDEQAAEAALTAAVHIRTLFQANALQHTPVGDFELAVKLGLAAGEMEAGLFGPETHRAYYFRGAAIDLCAQAEHYCEKGEIVLTAALMHKVAQLESAEIPHSVGFVRLTAHPPTPPLAEAFWPPLNFEIATLFFPRTLIETTQAGEFRVLVSVFVSIRDVYSADALDELTHLILAEVDARGGYFNRLDFGDKGCNMLIFFGAPVGHEDDLERAADFALALRASHGAQVRCGLTYGTLYFGMVGIPERCEFTALGDAVNYAARLMMKAEWGEVWLSEAAAQRLNALYENSPLGEFTFKGKSRAQPVFRLEQKRAFAVQAFFEGDMVGREAERTALREWSAPMFTGRFAGVAYVYGEAGLGKSRLVYELVSDLGTPEYGARALILQADNILAVSWGAFIYGLRHYFQDEQSQTVFVARHTDLINHLQKSADPRAKPIAAELQRTRSVLGALLGYSWKGSLYERLDPQGRYDNTLLALKAFFQALSLIAPILIWMEDLQWLDSDSQAAFNLLARDLAAYPLGFIVTSRLRDDGSHPTLTLPDDTPRFTLELAQLPNTASRELMRAHLNGQPDPALAALIEAKSLGNPFFVMQVCLYLRESGALEETPDQIHLNSAVAATLELPESITALLIARLDRLPPRLKETVQVAAVAGREFEVTLLHELLNRALSLPPDEHIAPLISLGEQEQVWSILADKGIFRHALLQEAAYEMQLRSRLKTLHQLTLEILEGAYHAQPTRAADLTHHAHHAGDTARERHYARAAGEYAATQFINAEAVRYFSRALELTPEAEHEERFELLLKREAILDLQGARETQLVDLETLAALVEHLPPLEQATVALRQAGYAEAISDYAASIFAAQRAKDLAQHYTLPKEEASAYLHWGTAAWRSSDYALANTQLAQALALAQEHAFIGVEAASLRLLGLVAYEQSLYPTARDYQEQALALYQQLGNPLGEARANGNLGNIAADLGDRVAAKAHYSRAQKLFSEIGARRNEGSLANNLGLLNSEEGRYSEAKAYYEKALRLFNEINSQAGVSLTSLNLGNMLLKLGQYQLAWECWEKALSLAKLLGDLDTEFSVLDAMALAKYQQGEYPEAFRLAQQAIALTATTGRQQGFAMAHTLYGHILVCRHNWAEAEVAYQTAITTQQQLGAVQRLLDALTGLANLEMQQGRFDSALTRLETVMAHLTGPLLNNAEEPVWILGVCYQLLHAVSDRRATHILEQAHDFVQTQAERITDIADKEAFLSQVATHRQIMEWWEATIGAKHSGPHRP